MNACGEVTSTISALTHFISSGMHGDGGNATVSCYWVCSYGTDAWTAEADLGDLAFELVDSHASGGGEDSV